MADLSSFKDLASEMIAEYGQAATLRRVREEGGPLDARRETLDAPVTVVDMGAESHAEFRSKGGESVSYRIRKLYMSVPAMANGGETEIVRGPWGSPEVMTETDIAGNQFQPPDTELSGARATNQGMFVWYTQGETQTMLHQTKGQNLHSTFTRNRNANGWPPYDIFGNIGEDYIIGNANREHLPLPLPKFILIGNASDNAQRNLPNLDFTGQSERYGILVDDATGQSLYYCNDQLTPPRCEHYRRAITDPQPIQYQPKPVEGDQIVLASGETLSISEVMEKAPDGTDLFYEVRTEI